jgi:hypothetical protein
MSTSWCTYLSVVFLVLVGALHDFHGFSLWILKEYLIVFLLAGWWRFGAGGAVWIFFFVGWGSVLRLVLGRVLVVTLVVAFEAADLRMLQVVQVLGLVAHLRGFGRAVAAWGVAHDHFGSPYWKSKKFKFYKFFQVLPLWDPCNSYSRSIWIWGPTIKQYYFSWVPAPYNNLASSGTSPGTFFSLVGRRSKWSIEWIQMFQKVK